MSSSPPCPPVPLSLSHFAQQLHSVAYEVDQVSSGINEMIRFQTTNMAQCGAQLSLPDNNVDQHVEQCGRRGTGVCAGVCAHVGGGG